MTQTFTMTLNSLVEQVISQRFAQSQQNNVEMWVLQSYKRIWHAADWPWKFVDTDLTVTASENTAQFATLDYAWEESLNIGGPGRVMAVYDEDGAELHYLTKREWDRLYKGFEDDTGTPNAWTPVRAAQSGSAMHFANLQWPSIKLGPTPDTDATYTAHMELGPTIPDSDDNEPLLPADFGYACLYGAMGIGLRLENDPTWQEIDAMFKEEIGLLINAYLPETLTPNRSYGGPDNFIYGR